MFKNIAFFREGGWHEIIDSVVISEQETKMEGVQHVYNRRDNIDAALVCKDGLREHTWTFNGKGAGFFHSAGQSKGNLVLALPSIRFAWNFYQIISGTEYE